MALTRKRRVSDPDPLPLPTRRPIALAPLPEPDAPILPTRTIVPMAVEPPPANVLQFPTRNMTPAVEAPEVPLDLPTYTRPAPATPTITESSSLPEPLLPVRERRVHKPGTPEYEQRLVRDLQAAPLKKLTRKDAAIKGFLHGLATGGLPGAAIEATSAAIAPDRMAKRSRGIEIARASANLDNAMKQEGEAAQIESYKALTTQRLNKPAEDAASAAAAARKERIARLITMHGRAGRYNPNDPEDTASQAIKREADLLGVTAQLVPYTKADKVPPRITVDDTTYERQDNGDWRPAAGLPTRQMVDVPGYGKMTPAQARIADATQEQRKYQRGRDETEDERRTRERTEDKGDRLTEKEQSRREKAAGIAGEVATHNAEAAKWQDLAIKTKTPETKQYYESIAVGEKQKANAKALELNQGYGDIYEAGPGEDGWAYVKPKELPTRKPSAAPAPKRSTKPKSDPLGLFK